MPARAFVIRFPNGDYEYDVGRGAAPALGETLRRRGALWSVTRITQEAVPTAHVERIGVPSPVVPPHRYQPADDDRQL